MVALLELTENGISVAWAVTALSVTPIKQIARVVCNFDDGILFSTFNFQLSTPNDISRILNKFITIITIITK